MNNYEKPTLETYKTSQVVAGATPLEDVTDMCVANPGVLA